MACACGSQPRFGASCACQTMRVRLTRLVRRPLKPVGELRGVIYRTRRVPGEAPKNYVHFFQRRLPMLVTNPTGTRLYIIGGQYRVTPRGIEG
ncbi:MAG TPA: hypothetical protein VIG57_13425 [Candidatus Entotheonella sp.]